MTFCFAGRIALFTLGLRTYKGGVKGSLAAMTQSQRSQERSGMVTSKGFHIEMWVRRSVLGPTPHESADDLNLPMT